MNLLYSRLKKFKKGMGRKFCLTVRTNGESNQLCHKWNHFLLFSVEGRVSLTLISREVSSKNGIFCLFVVTTRVFEKALCTTTKSQNCGVLVLESNVQNLAAHFALKTFGTSFIIFFPCMVMHTQFL